MRAVLYDAMELRSPRLLHPWTTEYIDTGLMLSRCQRSHFVRMLLTARRWFGYQVFMPVFIPGLVREDRIANFLGSK